jgi:hypothetical protein
MTEEQEVTPTEETVAAPPTQVSTEDLRELEVVNLRKLVSAQQIAILQHQLEDAVRRNTEATRQANITQMEIAKKYGIDLSTHEIRATDGLIMPRSAAAANLQRMLQR